MKKPIYYVPPVAVTAVCLLISAWMAGFEVTWGAQSVAVVVLCLIGAVIAIAALLGFRRKQTTVNPLDPEQANQLVIKGVYRFSRNPMYLSMLCWVVASCLLFVSTWGFLSAVVYVVYLTEVQIKPEEAALEKRFGRDYLDYKAKVRRWI